MNVIHKTLCLLLGLSLSGCYLPSGPKTKVTHSILAPVSPQREGRLVLREESHSFEKQRKIIGNRQLHGTEYFAYFNPLFLMISTMEIDSHKPLNAVLLQDMAETLRLAGYQVMVQKRSGEPLPRKWRNYPVVELAIDEFDYLYYSSRVPNSFTIQVRLLIPNPDDATPRWTKTYQSRIEAKPYTPETTIRQGLDEVLKAAAHDFVSDDFYAKIQAPLRP